MPRVRALIAVLAVWLLPIPVQASPAAAAAIVLEPAVGPPTTVTTVSGSGFLPQERVIVDLDGSPAAQSRADRDGGLRARVVVPGSALPDEHPVTATGQQSGSSAEATFLVRTDWAEYRKNDAHTGYNPFENVLGPSNVSGLTVAWKAELEGTITSSVAVADGVVYAAPNAHRLVAFDATTGSRLWTAHTDSLIASSPAVANGVVYVPSYFDGTLHAFDASSGAELWSMSTSDYMTASPVVVNGMLYEGGYDHYLYAFALPSGSRGA
jgi:glucose dehydrogenase